MDTQNPFGTVSKVPERMDWRMKFAPAHAPAPQLDPEALAAFNAAMIDAAIDHDAAVAMEPEGQYNDAGIRIYATWSPEHRRPFIAADTGVQHN